MINVLLTSELPWQRNDAMTFYLPSHTSRYQEHFRKSIKGTFTYLGCLKYDNERFVCERFGNILQSFGHKNSEINMLSVLLANI